MLPLPRLQGLEQGGGDQERVIADHFGRVLIL